MLLVPAVIAFSSQARALPPLRLSAEAGLTKPVVGARAQRFLGLAADVPVVPRALEVALGGRLASGAVTPDPAVSGFVRLSLCAWQAPYNPAMGLELELGPGSRPHASSAIPDSLERSFNAGHRDNPLWANVLIEPLRFELGAYFVSGLGLRLGTPISGDSGRRAQLGVSLLRLGYRVLP